MSPEMLQQLLAGGESQTVEFKLPSTPTDLLGAVVCAFLNSRGGTLVIGADEDGQPVAVPQARTRAEELQRELLAAIKPRAMFSITVDSMNQRDILLLEVPVGHERPYLFREKIYVRRGKSTQAATAHEMSSLIERQHPTENRWERMAALGATLDDLDQEAILQTAAEAQTSRFVSFKNAQDVVAVLDELNLYRNGEVLNGALVLFGKDPARLFPQIRVRAAVFSGQKTGEFVDNKSFQGHAFKLLTQIEDFLRANVKIASKFPEGQLARNDVPEFPWIALREGVINALVHRDYSAFSGGVSIGVYPDRIEVWNSGQLPPTLSVKDLAREHPSLPNNPDIAHVFFLRRQIERWGRGTRSIVEECVNAGLPQPKWKVNAAGVTLVYFSRATAQSVRNVHFNIRQRALINRLKSGERIEPRSYYAETANQVSQRQAQRDLTALESAGLLRHEGDGPATIYVRTELPMSG